MIQLIQRGKFSEAFNLCRPKALLIVPLNLKSVVSLAFLLMKIVTSHSMHLDEKTYESTSLKEDVLHYYQELVNHLRVTDKLVTFQRAPGKQRLQRPQLTTMGFLSIGRYIN